MGYNNHNKRENPKKPKSNNHHTINYMLATSDYSKEFIVDSGASISVVNDPSLLKNVQNCDTTFAQTAKGISFCNLTNVENYTSKLVKMRL